MDSSLGRPSSTLALALLLLALVVYSSIGLTVDVSVGGPELLSDAGSTLPVLENVGPDVVPLVTPSGSVTPFDAAR